MDGSARTTPGGAVQIQVKLLPDEVLDLSTQFSEIMRAVEISDGEQSVHLDLMKRIQKQAHERNPRIQMATLFRHNYLGLRNAGSNQFLVFLCSLQYRTMRMSRLDVDQLFEGSQFHMLPEKHIHDVEAGYPFLDAESGLLVGIVNHSDHIEEVGACQLAKYLISFDPRAKSVLTLVQYWARENKITLSSKQLRRSDTSNIPDPAALEWLVLFFLGQEKVIPTLQKLRTRAKSKSLLFIEELPQFNISFPCDEKLVHDWKLLQAKNVPPPGSSQYVLNVLQLVLGFFRFCSRDDLKGKMLNTISCKIIPILEAIEEGLIKSALKANNCNDRNAFELLRKKALALEKGLEDEIYLGQPFHNLQFQFNQQKFDTQVRPQMENTATKLAFYLNNLQEQDTTYEVNLKTLFMSGSGMQHLVYGTLKCDYVMMSIVPKTYESVREELGLETWVTLEQTPVLQLAIQFAEMCADVEIPDKEFLVLTNLTERIRKIAGAYDSKVKYTTIFRHNYLKLRNAVSNQVLIYMSKFQHLPLSFNRRQTEKLFEGSQLTPLRAGSEEMEAGYPYFDEQSGLKIGLVTDPHNQTEVVTCQLAKYLFKFDPRAKSLVTLVHYWARENGVTLADAESNVPDPAALEWLVLFFLGKKKLIPTLQVLLNRARGKRDPFFEGNKNINVAFPNDIKFIGEWREEKMKNIGTQRSDEYVLEMLQLAQEFFEFFGDSVIKGKVLYTVNGEIVPILSAIKDGLVDTSHKTLVMEAELKDELYLMQPFLNRRFDVCQEKFGIFVRPRMEKTAEKLALYLESRRITEHDGTVFDVDLKSLFKCETEEVLYGVLEVKDNIQPGPKCETVADLELAQEQDEIEEAEALEDNSREFLGQSQNGSLLQLFQQINNEVAINDPDWAVLIELQKKLKNFYESHGFFDCQIELFRNSYLKLQLSEPDIFVYLEHSGLFTVESEVLTSNRELGREINDNPAYSEQTKCLLLATLDSEAWPVIGTIQELSPISLLDGKNFYFAKRPFLPEVEACRLVEYYCTLDPRVKPLMTIVFYWAKLNNIRLGEDELSRFTVGAAPDPALLEWLVIFFLCQKGILTPPSEISGRNADESLIFEGINMRLQTDPESARARWNYPKETDEEQHIYNVFELALEFFHFWSQFRFQAMMDPIIVDLKNGNFFLKEEVYNSENRSLATGISQHDLELLDSEPKTRDGFYSYKEVVTILHPVHINYGFSFSWKAFLLTVCPKMEATSQNFKKMLTFYNDGDIVSDEIAEFSPQILFKVIL